MPEYKVGYTPATGVAQVVTLGGTLPEGAIDIGNFVHTPDDDSDGYDANKVTYHFVRDLLYHQGVLDMQRVKIMAGIHVTGISVGAATTSIAVEGTHQIVTTVLPADAQNKSLTYLSADTDVATVSSSGLVTGVAAGESVVTVTSVDGGFTATVTVTVTE
jgi:uncharacterized protein YjdB